MSQNQAELKFASIVSLLTSTGLLYIGYVIKKQHEQLNELSSKKVHTPSSLTHELQKPLLSHKISKNPDNPNEYLINAFVEGYVDCTRPFKSIINGKTNLVYSYSYKKEIRANDATVEIKGISLDGVRNIVVGAPASFTLKDPNTNDSCIVHRNLDVDATTALKRVAERTELRKLNFVENMVVNVGRFMELVSVTGKSLFGFRGLSVGWTETEFGVTVGSVLTVYGQVIFNAKDSKLRIDTPLFFLQDKGAFLKKCRQDIRDLYGVFAFIFIPFAISTYYLVKRGLGYYRNLKLRKEEEIAAADIDKGRFANIDDEYKCIICVDKPRNVILKPCMHFSLCKDCYNRLPKQTCPICKKTINDIVDVHIT